MKPHIKFQNQLRRHAEWVPPTFPSWLELKVAERQKAGKKFMPRGRGRFVYER